MVYFDLPPHLPSQQPVVEVVASLSAPAEQKPDNLLNELLASANKEASSAANAADFVPFQLSAVSALAAESKQLPSPARLQAQSGDLPELNVEPVNAENDLPRLNAEPIEPESDTPVPGAFERPIQSEPQPDSTLAEPTQPVDTRPADTPTVDTQSTDALPTEGAGDLTPEEFISQLRLTADFQEYDPAAQVVTARGNVVLRLNDAIIETDELWLNLINRYALADGEVLLTRGAQIVRGSRLEYNFIQQAGTVNNAVGTLYLPDIEGDLRSPLESPSQTSPTAVRRAYDPINRDLQVFGDGSVQIATSDSTRPSNTAEGNLRQLRFETASLSFDVEGWRANDVRITNDPFSPPELELRATSLWLRNISPQQDELLLKRPRLVFDQGFSLPLLRNRILLSRGTVNPDDLSPVPASVGVDGSDRGGLYLGREVPLVASDRVRFTATPQFFLAKALSSEGSPLSLDNFGVTSELSATLGPRTTLNGSADLTSLDPVNITEKLRTSLRAEQLIGDHRLAVQYSYRERLFNGSLGFQDVQSSFGAVLLSPTVQLGENGPQLTYQASAQLINAETDRANLRSNSGRVTLGRYQVSAALRKNFNLWRGEPKPPTQDEGLRFTPEPVVPYLNLTSGIRTTGTRYSNGDFQSNLIAEIGIEGQVGHFARNFADYTRFNAGYSQSFIGGANSPFLFDREVDRNILSLGIVQQIYGPFLAGFQTALSFNENRAINTILSLEYSRRTYGILVRYDTTQNTGSVGFRLSNFSWIGDSDPFDTPRVRRVEGGVIEQP
ncbi:MAG: DUF3769 domain-containing protein [Phormidesmis sp.]